MLRGIRAGQILTSNFFAKINLALPKQRLTESRPMAIKKTFIGKLQQHETNIRSRV